MSQSTTASENRTPISRRRALTMLAAVPAALAVAAAFPASVSAETATTASHPLMTVLDVYDNVITGEGDPDDLALCSACSRYWPWADRPIVDDDCPGRVSRVPVWAETRGREVFRRVPSMHVLYSAKSLVEWSIDETTLIIADAIERIPDYEDIDILVKEMQGELLAMRRPMERKYGAPAALIWVTGVEQAVARVVEAKTRVA